MEQLDQLARLFVSAWGKKGSASQQKPLRISRPYEKKPEKRRAASPHEVIAELARKGVYIVNNAEES